MSGRLRVGVVGCGGIAQMMHLPTLAERPDLFEIVALADLSEKTLNAVGDRYGVRARFKDGRELASQGDVEAILLFASGCHREAVLGLLGARKPIFVEKPLAFSLPETEEVARAVRAAGIPFMVGYHKRFDPGYQRARRAVQQMRDLRYVEVTILHPDDDAYRTHHVVLPRSEGPWVPRPEAEGTAATIERITRGPFKGCVDHIVGVDAPLAHRVGAYLLFDSLIHDVDAVRGVLGDPESVVSAHVWRDGFAQTSVTRFASDLRVSLTWVSVPGLKHYEERLKFVGTDARVTLTFPSPYIRHAPTPVSIERMDGEELVVEEHTVSYEEAFRAELHHFRDAVQSGRPPEPSLADALGDARWIHQIAAAYAGGGAR
jgi:predicted dehydrogenase